MTRRLLASGTWVGISTMCNLGIAIGSVSKARERIGRMAGARAAKCRRTAMMGLTSTAIGCHRKVTSRTS